MLFSPMKEQVIELGYSVRPFGETIGDTVEWFKGSEKDIIYCFT